MSTNVTADSKLTRLCHVIKRDDFDGYGFNLHAEKGKPGQYIGKVDDDSPAEVAGLKQGDRIIEVNGVNIENETHREVVERIKAVAREVRLLVVDPRESMPSDESLVDNDAQLDSTENNSDLINGLVGNVKGISSVSSIGDDTDLPTLNSPSPPPRSSANSLNNFSHANSTPNQTSPEKSTKPSPKSNGSGGGLNLSMTAAELRAKLAAKKKYDPKTDTVDLRKKYEIIQKL